MAGALTARRSSASSVPRVDDSHTVTPLPGVRRAWTPWSWVSVASTPRIGTTARVLPAGASPAPGPIGHQYSCDRDVSYSPLTSACGCVDRSMPQNDQRYVDVGSGSGA